MKSNEEFIAGIYEKAAVYTEEKETKIVKVNFAARALKTAAMVVLCLGLAGVGVMTLEKNNAQVPDKIPAPAEENYSIALSSEVGEEQGEAPYGVAQFRMIPVAETVTFTGVVESIDTAENRIWLELVFDETAPMWAEGSVVCIRWDMLEPISEEITAGVTLTATGVLSMYENEASVHNGCAELVLTDAANLEMK